MIDVTHEKEKKLNDLINSISITHLKAQLELNNISKELSDKTYDLGKLSANFQALNQQAYHSRAPDKEPSKNADLSAYLTGRKENDLALPDSLPVARSLIWKGSAGSVVLGISTKYPTMISSVQLIPLAAKFSNNWSLHGYSEKFLRLEESPVAQLLTMDSSWATGMLFIIKECYS